MSKYLQIPEDSLELMLGGRSSSDDESIIAGMVSTLVRFREEIGLKDVQKVKIGAVLTNLF
jgi:hypothetical protein